MAETSGILAVEFTTTLDETTIEVSGNSADFGPNGDAVLTLGPNATVNLSGNNARLRSDAFVTGDSQIVNRGLVEGTGNVRIVPDAFLNRGIVRVSSNVLTVDGDAVTNEAAGVFEVLPGGTLRASPAWPTGPGTIDVMGGQLNGSNAITNTGTVSGFGTVTGTFINEGVVNSTGPTPADRLDFAGRVSGGGDFQGDVVVSGVLAPGGSPGSMSFEDLTFAPAGTFEFDFEGPGDGQFDRLDATGTVALDGTLELVLPEDFTPTLGDTVRIIEADGGVEGRFAEVSNVVFIPGELVFAPIYMPNEVFMVAARPGDFDGDGDVDAFDLGLWQTGFGLTQGAGIQDGDADADGDVDAFDLGVWQFNFGETLAAEVPEPATGLCLLVGIGLARRSRGRTRRG